MLYIRYLADAEVKYCKLQYQHVKKPLESRSELHSSYTIPACRFLFLWHYRKKKRNIIWDLTAFKVLIWHSVYRKYICVVLSVGMSVFDAEDHNGVMCDINSKAILLFYAS